MPYNDHSSQPLCLSFVELPGDCEFAGIAKLPRLIPVHSNGVKGKGMAETVEGAGKGRVSVEIRKEEAGRRVVYEKEERPSPGGKKLEMLPAPFGNRIGEHGDPMGIEGTGFYLQRERPGAFGEEEIYAVPPHRNLPGNYPVLGKPGDPSLLDPGFSQAIGIARIKAEDCPLPFPCKYKGEGTLPPFL